jgi:uncharacterized membrane protein
MLLAVMSGRVMPGVRRQKDDYRNVRLMQTFKLALKYVLGFLFVAAGLNHFFNPEFYLKIMPPYLPWHLPLVYVSGIVEAVLGAALMVRRSTRLAAWGLIALLVAVYPANIHMALNPELYPEYGRAALWLRLPLQLVLMVLVYWYTRGDERRPGRRATADA